jgi:nitroreductase
MTGPGPSAAELNTLLQLAARAPDHGKLFPWRFIVLDGAAKAAFADKLEHLAQSQNAGAKAVATLAKLRTPPLCIAVISKVVQAQIPEWEQVLSAGAVCMNLLNAAGAMGYGANWITDWYAYDPDAKAMLGLQVHEQVAGFVLIGASGDPPLERVRPDMADLVTRWTPGAQG